MRSGKSERNKVTRIVTQASMRIETHSLVVSSDAGGYYLLIRFTAGHHSGAAR